jgi:Leucine-rich repeat (LRR) protein
MSTSARINDPTEVTEADVQRILDDGRAPPTIQFSRSGIPLTLLKQVNNLCRLFGDALEVRFYGFYGEVFDGDILEALPDVRWLSLDCLTEIRNEDRIRSLASLSNLGFGVFQFDRPDILQAFPLDQLKSLSLGPTAKNNIDLSPVSNCTSAREFLVCGHTRNISEVGKLRRLEALYLTSMPKKQTLGFVSELEALRTLVLTLGGRTSIDEVSLKTLENLTLLRVQGFDHLGALSRFPELRRLQIEDQPRLTGLNLAGPPLEEVIIANCKALTALEGLGELKDIRHLRLGLTGLDLGSLADRDWPESLDVLALWSGRAKYDAETRTRLDARGYRQFPARAD